jgi:NADH-quinone oxidoreductase subunit C
MKNNPMNKPELIQFVKTLAPDCEAKEGKQYAEALVPGESLHDLAGKLKENEESLFDFLVCITGVDYGKELGCIYQLRSTKYSHNLILKVKTSDRENPNFDSLTDLWKSADFLEREVYDLLGIKFNNHPDLRRLFLDNSWGFPLRKDYVDDVNIVTK